MNASDPKCIAPCGVNCSVCMAFLRDRNKCSGCRESFKNKPATRINCKIKNCENLNSEFCYTCLQFPCERLSHMDKRYRKKYHLSVIDNLSVIRDAGINELLVREKKKWTCAACGGTICAHKGGCIQCGTSFIP
jgi:hypothetical protein